MAQTSKKPVRPPTEESLEGHVRDSQGGTVAETNQSTEVAPLGSDIPGQAETAPDISDMSCEMEEWKPLVGPAYTYTQAEGSGFPSEPPNQKMYPGPSGDDHNLQKSPYPDSKLHVGFMERGLQPKVILTRQMVEDPGKSTDSGEHAGKELGHDIRSPTKGSPSKANTVSCFSCPCQMVFLKEEDFLKHKETCQLSQDSLSASSSSTSTSISDTEPEDNEDFFLDKSRYQCKSCRFRSSHREKVVEHQKNHDPRFKCTGCQKQLTSYSSLIQHRTRNNCAVKHVKKLSRSLGSLRHGKKLGRPLDSSKHGKKLSRPPSKPTRSESDTEKKDRHMNLPLLSCPECPMKTLYKMNMLKHEGLHKNPLAIPCKVCRRPFKVEYQLRLHMKEEHGVVIRIGMKQSKLSSSKISPSKQKAYTHEKSKKGLPSNRRGKFSVNEIRGFQRQKNGQFKCKHCSYATDQSHNFIRHLETDKHVQAMGAAIILERRQDGNFVCHFCNYSTGLRDSISKHLTTEKHRHTEAEAESKQRKRPLSSSDVKSTGATKQTVSMSSPVNSAKKKKKMDESGSVKSMKRTLSTPSFDTVTKKARRTDESGSDKSMKQTASTPSSNTVAMINKTTDESGSTKATKRTVLSPTCDPVVKKKKEADDTGFEESLKQSGLTPSSHPDAGKNNQTDQSSSEETIVESSKGKSCYSQPVISRTVTPSQVLESEDTEIDAGDKDCNDGKKFVALIEDFKDFRKRPYACALCFYRTGKFEELNRHCKNHLTGGEEETSQHDSDLHVGSTSEVQDNNTQQHVPHSSVPYNQSPLQGPVGGYPVNRNAGIQIPSSSNQTPFAPPYPQTGPWGSFTVPFAPGLPQLSPHFNPQVNYYSSTQPGQSRTDDLIDPGTDYTKDPSNINPYKCLYCPLRFQSFMMVVGHFDTSHYNIVKAKAAQASMRYQAAQAAENVKTEPLLPE